MGYSFLFKNFTAHKEKQQVPHKMSRAIHSNSNRVQLLHSLLTFVMLGLALESCNAHYNYYNKTNGKGIMSSMGHVKGYGKGGGGGGGASSKVHVKQSKAHRNTININGSSTMSDEPTAPPSKETKTDEPTAPPSMAVMTNEPTAPPSKATCVVSSSTEARVCLLLDSSGSIDNSEFQLSLNFSQGLVSAIDTTSPESLYSVVFFAYEANIKLNYSDATTTLAELPKQIRLVGGTFTHLGFEKCQETFDLGDGKSHVIIILTDGDPDDPFLADSAANATKATGTKIVCIGVGNGIVNETLSRWSTIPELTFQADSFADLEYITSSFTTTISCA